MLTTVSGRSIVSTKLVISGRNRYRTKHLMQVRLIKEASGTKCGNVLELISNQIMSFRTSFAKIIVL